MDNEQDIEAEGNELVEIADRRAEAMGIVRRFSAWGFGAGCIPVPLLDMATVTGVQLQMINKLSQVYGIPFSEHTAKNIVAALLGSIVPHVLTWGALGTAIKGIPVVGSALALLTMPGFSAAVTYAIGKVFIQHLEAGGTLLDFDPEEMRTYFKEEFDQAMAEQKSSGKRSKSGGQAAAA